MSMRFVVVGIDEGRDSGYAYGRAPTERGAYERAEKLAGKHPEKFFHVARIVRSVPKKEAAPQDGPVEAVST